MKGQEYLQKIELMIERAWKEQMSIIEEAIHTIMDAIKSKRNIFIFGCSHAGILAEELFYRTGGLAVINPIFIRELMLDSKPVTLTSSFERIEGLAVKALRENPISAGDVLIIHSVSGRNIVPVEMAIEARAKGVTVIALTNLEYSKNVESRHPSGRKLYEVSDIVLDNMGPFGDACIIIEGLNLNAGPSSTVVGAALLNAIILEVIERLLNNGVLPPVFLSANIDGGDEYNQKVLDEYKNNIFYMKQ